MIRAISTRRTLDRPETCDESGPRNKPIIAMTKWWKRKKILTITDNKFLVLSRTYNLSHAKFSTKRFKLSFQDALIIDIEENGLSIKMVASITSFKPI